MNVPSVLYKQGQGIVCPDDDPETVNACVEVNPL
jgi:hypothetical protein